MFSLGNCNRTNSYNIFGAEQPHKRASVIMAENINLENCWKQCEDEEKLLKKLKEHINECNRSDFETDAEYHLELSRRINYYSTTKEILWEKKRHISKEIVA